MVWIALSLGLACAVFCLGVNLYLVLSAQRSIPPDTAQVPRSQAAIVFGAKVYADGRLYAMTYDRLATAVDLYKAGRVQKLLISGDHGRPDYDEVNAMRRQALEWEVPPADIFMDHAGFSTYDTVARARRVFGVQKAVLVTQRYHLPRALYLARRAGVDATGVAADRRLYLARRYQAVRELAARVKDFFKGILNPSPRFLGPEIPITGDGRCTVDS